MICSFILPLDFCQQHLLHPSKLPTGLPVCKDHSSAAVKLMMLVFILEPPNLQLPLGSGLFMNVFQVLLEVTWAFMRKSPT